MKKIFSFIICCLLTVFAISQHTNTIAVIPEPVSVVINTGHFSVRENTVISAPDIPEMKEVTWFLKERLSLASVGRT